MRVALVFLGILALATARPEKDNRIAGGTATTINQYPYSVAVLYSSTGNNFQQTQGGVILNQRSVLTVANPLLIDPRPVSWRSRVGSTFANNGGTVHVTSQIIIHNFYNPVTSDNDIAILRLASLIDYIPNVVAQAGLAGENYTIADNQPVWAIGWGLLTPTGPRAEQLQHVQIWTISRNICQQRYASISLTITDNMLCAGWLDVPNSHGQCLGDNGSPLVHNNVVVGVYAWGLGCGTPFVPGLNTRVTPYIDWIRANT